MTFEAQAGSLRGELNLFKHFRKKIAAYSHCGNMQTLKHCNEDVTFSLVISPRRIISATDPALPVTFCICPEKLTLIFEASFDFVSILMKVPCDGRLKMEADADEGEITFCTTM